MSWQQIYLAANALEANLIKGALEAEGIDCLLEGEALSGASGELPTDVQQLPLLVHPRDLSAAMRLVEAYQQRHTAPVWFCRHCGEENDPRFEICWQCQQPCNE